MHNQDQETDRGRDDTDAGAESEANADGAGGPILLRRTVLKTSVAGAALAAVGGYAALADDEDEDNDEDEAHNGEDEDLEEYAVVVFPNQVTDGSSIEIESAYLPDGGFISLVDPVAGHETIWPIADETMPDLDDILATQVKGATEYLDAGEHEEIVLETNEPIEGEKLYQVWIHQDTTGDETFTFVESVGEDDGPYPAEFDVDAADDGDDDDDDTGDATTIEPGTAIELDGQTGGWVGIEPSDIDGETNPTLSLVDGESYEIGWTTGDGQAHNLVIQDEGGDTVDDLATEITDDPGDGLWLSFDASGEMTSYVCTPHAGSMTGEIAIVEDTDGADTEDEGEDDEEEVVDELHDDGNGDDDPDADPDDEEVEGDDEPATEDEEAVDDAPDDEMGEIRPTQVPPVAMGDAYLHRLEESGEGDTTGGTVERDDGHDTGDTDEDKTEEEEADDEYTDDER